MVTNKGVNDEINDEDLTLEPIIVPLKKQILHQTRINQNSEYWIRGILVTSTLITIQPVLSV